MARKKNLSNNGANVAVAADAETITEGTDTVTTTETTADDEIDAVLAMINGGAVQPVSEPETLVVNDLADEVEVEVIEGAGGIEVVTVETEDDIAAAMADIEDMAEGDGGSAFVDDSEVEIEPEDVDAAIAELDAEQDTTAAPAKKTRKASNKAPAQPAAPKRNFTDVAAIDADTLKANLDANNAKKVAEKVGNVIQAIESGKKLSRYTADAVKKLATDGRVSGKSLVEHFLSLQLSDGTARAQAQQMTAMFKMLGIAMPDPNNARELVVADKELVDELVAMAVAA